MDIETEVTLPDFGDEPEQCPIGLWKQRHLRYIQEYKKALYTELLTGGRLNDYLTELNEVAEDKPMSILWTKKLIHSHCDYVSPNEYEKKYWIKLRRMEINAA